MANIEPISVKFNVDTSGLQKAESAVQSSTSGMKKKFGGIGKAAAAAFAVAATAAAINFGKELIKVGEAASTNNARIDQISESMGLFGDNAATATQRIKDLAEETARKTGVDQNLIKESQAVLLTFENIGKTADEAGSSFDRATAASLDLAAAGLGSAESNAVALGKALNDPITGITALNRSGVTFTENEKEKIKTLVESNNTLEAQDMILDAIEKQVGGTAEATADASDRLDVAFGLLKEDLAEELIPVFEDFVDYMINEVVPAISEGIEFFKENKDTILVVAGVIGGLVASFTILKGIVSAYTTVQILLNTAMFKNPIGLVVLAVAALVAGIVYLATQTTVFQDIWAGLTEAFNTVKDVISSTIESAKETITGFFDTIFGFLEGIGEKLYEFGKTAWEMFVQGALDALLFLPTKVGEILADIPGIGLLGDSILDGVGATRDAVSAATGTQNTGASLQQGRGGETVVNNYNVEARGLTVDQVQQDAKRRSNLLSPVGGGI